MLNDSCEIRNLLPKLLQQFKMKYIKVIYSKLRKNK